MNKLTTVILLTTIVTSYTFGQQKNSKSYGPELKNSIIWQRGIENNLNEAHSVGFRKQVEIRNAPEKAKMMIFADSRYVLWINGKYVERGPCRFDPKGPQYDVIDIKKYINKGQNTIAVMVQGNVTGSLKVMKHIPGLTSILKVDNQQFITDTTWRCSDQIPEQILKERWTWSCILDSVDANTRDFSWQLPLFNDMNWGKAVYISGKSWGPLAPRAIPLLKESDLGSGTILQIKNISTRDTLVKKLPENLPMKFKTGDEIIIGQLISMQQKGPNLNLLLVRTLLTEKLL
jgi:hypothetical protein